MNSKRQTLVILTPGFPKDEGDSTCLPFLQAFVRTLKENFSSLNLIVIALQYPFFAGEYEWHHCKVISLYGWNKGKIAHLLLRLRIWRILKKIRKENDLVGLLSFWCGESAFIGSRFGRRFNIRHHGWIQGQDAKKKNRYVKRIRPVANELIALSDFIQLEFERNHHVKPRHVIPPGIDTRQFSKEPVRKDIDILGAGSLISLKQYDIFLDLVYEIKKQLPEIKVVLCGKGPEQIVLQKKIDELLLAETVLLTGELPHSEVLRYMQRTKIFLHPSSYEGFGVVCLESLYSGAHVISFCKPMNEKIDQWHIADTTEMMTQKAIDLLQSSLTRYDPVLPFSIDVSVKKIMQLFSY
jgi:glycosyltransferase involved in cell wall biosynthesis